MDRKQEILQDITTTLQSELNGDLVGAWLIGSQAGRQVLRLSDIDIAIETSSQLSVENINHIKNQLNNLRTLYPIDLVWLNDCTDSFRQTALGNAEALFS
jgi:predicted nucleotidyltransferase